jgi:hypothetical protein
VTPGVEDVRSREEISSPNRYNNNRVVRTKTRYLINENDIDMLDVTEYLEIRMPGNE